MKRITIILSIVVILVTTFVIPASASIGNAYHPIDFTEVDFGY